MKLLKKLLPIASVASVAAIVAPIATSCSGGTTIDGIELFVPTIAKAIADEEHKETGYNNGDATQLYFKDLKNNPEIFKQDGLAVASSLAQTIFQSGIGDKDSSHQPELKWSYDYSDIEVDDTKAKENLSFSVKSSIYFRNVHYRFRQSGSNITLTDADLSIEFVATKLPYGLEASDSKWILTLSNLTKDASVDIRVSGYVYGLYSQDCAIFDNESLHIDKDNVDEPEGKGNLISIFTNGYMRISPVYHMSEIEQYKEP